MASLNATRKNHPASSFPFPSSEIRDNADYLVSVGLHKTRGIMDSYYLNLAGEMLHQKSSQDRA